MGLFQRKKTDFSAESYDISIDDGFHNSSTETPDAIKKSPKKTLSSAPNVPSTLDFNALSGNKAEEYGVSDLINLFHSLPQQNFDAEISAAVRTIASFDVNIKNLIDDITIQDSLAKKRVKVLELEVELFKAKIRTRKKELDLLQIGITELAKSKDYLQQGLAGITDEEMQSKQRMQKKKAANLKNKAEWNNSIPLAEKIRIATCKEMEQANPPSKIKSLRDKFKRRLMKN